jgi:hypothetical protein
MKQEIRATQEQMLAKMEANTKAIRKDIKSGQEEMRSIVDALMTDRNNDRKETTTSQEATEVNTEKTEPDPEMKAVAEHQEVPMEEAVVKSSGTMKKRHRGRHRAAERRGDPKKLNRGECGSRTKFAAACRKVSRRAALARRKRNFFRKIRTEENCGQRKKLTAAGMRKGSECKNRHKGPRPKTAAMRQRANKSPRRHATAMPEEGEQNKKRHQRV